MLWNRITELHCILDDRDLQKGEREKGDKTESRRRWDRSFWVGFWLEFIAFQDVEGGVDKVEHCADESENLKVIKSQQIKCMVKHASFRVWYSKYSCITPSRT